MLHIYSRIYVSTYMNGSQNFLSHLGVMKHNGNTLENAENQMKDHRLNINLERKKYIQQN